MEYILGRCTISSQIVQEYSDFEVAYEDLSEIPELVEIYNTDGKSMVIILHENASLVNIIFRIMMSGELFNQIYHSRVLST